MEIQKYFCLYEVRFWSLILVFRFITHNKQVHCLPRSSFQQCPYCKRSRLEEAQSWLIRKALLLCRCQCPTVVRYHPSFGV